MFSRILLAILVITPVILLLTPGCSGMALKKNKHKKYLKQGEFGFQLVEHQSPMAEEELKKFNREAQTIFFPSTFGSRHLSHSRSNCVVRPECREREVLQYRTHDGSCNNLIVNTAFGMSNLPFTRLMPKQSVTCKTEGLPNPRMLSQLMIKRAEDPMANDFSLMVMTWGQIVDHDMELTPPREAPGGEFLDCCVDDNLNSDDCCPIISARDDAFYGKENRPTCMPFLRSLLGKPVCGSESEPDVVNANTPWIDGGFVYGSNKKEADVLRTFVNGNMSTSADRSGRDWPPIELNDGIKWLFGDRRGDVHPGATMLTTVFLRNHNRLAKKLFEKHPDWSDEKLYQEARKINVAIIQRITFTNFLDSLLGIPNDVTVTFKRKGHYFDTYDPKVDPAINMGFGTAGYRLHTYVSGHFDLRDSRFQKTKTLKLRDVFHQPLITMANTTYDDLMRGMCGQPLQKFDNVFTGEMTEWLFKEKDQNWGLDIAALNIQRGRDHKIPGYIHYREFCGLGDVRSWDSVTDLIPGDLSHRLVHVYQNIDHVDLYVAGNMEAPVEGSILGPTFHCLVRNQFRKLRDGDRFFYTNPGHFTPIQMATLDDQTLARVMCDNADARDEMMLPKNMFKLADPVNNPLFSCADHRRHPPLDITAF